LPIDAFNAALDSVVEIIGLERGRSANSIDRMAAESAAAADEERRARMIGPIWAD
jgi:hypothetical protein